MNGTVDLELVPAFVAVVRTQSFTKAARELGVPKSTISRRLARLEEQLGVQLLARTTRSLHLTDAGEAYFARVLPALEAVDEAGRIVLEQQREPAGVLRLSAPFDFGTIFLAEMLERFVQKYPGIRVEMDLSGRLVDLVGEGFDAAFRAGELADSSLVARKLTDVVFHLFASRAYVEKNGAPASVAELGAHRCILFRAREGKEEWKLAKADGASAKVEVHGALTANDLGFVRAAVLAGAGIALLPRYSFPREEERNAVMQLLSEWRLGREQGLYLVYPSARPLPQKIVALRDFVLDWLAHLPAPCSEAFGVGKR